MRQLCAGLVAILLSVPSHAPAAKHDPIETLEGMFLELVKERNCVLAEADFEEFRTQMASLNMSRADQERLEDVLKAGQFLDQPYAKFGLLDPGETVEFEGLCE